MQENLLKNLVREPPAWQPQTGDELIAVSSRIRLARNVEGAPFPARCDHLLRQCIADRICREAGGLAAFRAMVRVDFPELDAVEREIFRERRLASRELCTGGPGSALLFSPGDAMSLMINEEDHLRLQIMVPGLGLSAAWETIARADAELSRRLDFSFDDQWGYLTSCPTNVGTGLRASVMLHLPALGMAGVLESVLRAVQTLGFEVRGALGEGTEAAANLFQISNRSTLGESEAGIIHRLETLIRQLIWHERNARVRLTGKDTHILYDTVGRAYGVLRHARSLTTQEALNGLSALRLGVDAGLFSRLRPGELDALFLAVQPAHLQWRAGKELSPEERDIRRADFVRKILRRSARSPASDETDEPTR